MVKKLSPGNGLFYTAVVLGGTKKRLKLLFEQWAKSYRIKIIQHIDGESKPSITIRHADLLIILKGQLSHKAQINAVEQAKTLGHDVILTDFKRVQWYQAFRRRRICSVGPDLKVLEHQLAARKKSAQKPTPPDPVRDMEKKLEQKEKRERSQLDIEVDTKVKKIIAKMSIRIASANEGSNILIWALTGMLFEAIQGSAVESILITDKEVHVEKR